MVFTVNSSSEQWRPGDSGTVCLKEEKKQKQKENSYIRILYLTKILFRNGEITFSDQQNRKNLLVIDPHYKKQCFSGWRKKTSDETLNL